MTRLLAAAAASVALVASGPAAAAKPAPLLDVGLSAVVTPGRVEIDPALAAKRLTRNTYWLHLDCTFSTSPDIQLQFDGSGSGGPIYFNLAAGDHCTAYAYNGADPATVASNVIEFTAT